jgi:hypothetical protein
VGHALRLAGHEPPIGVLRGPARVLSLGRPIYRHADSAYPSQRAHHDRDFRGKLGCRRPDALAEPKVALTLLGPALPELLDLVGGPFVPEADLSQGLIPSCVQKGTN